VTRLRMLLRDARAIARPYRFGDDRWAGRGLLLVVVVVTLELVYQMLLIRWRRWLTESASSSWSATGTGLSR